MYIPVREAMAVTTFDGQFSFKQDRRKDGDNADIPSTASSSTCGGQCALRASRLPGLQTGNLLSDFCHPQDSLARLGRRETQKMNADQYAPLAQGTASALLVRSLSLCVYLGLSVHDNMGK